MCSSCISLGEVCGLVHAWFRRHVYVHQGYYVRTHTGMLRAEMCAGHGAVLHRPPVDLRNKFKHTYATHARRVCGMARRGGGGGEEVRVLRPDVLF